MIRKTVNAGINKNLLTPCRRIGLSKIKKTNSFISPLQNTNQELHLGYPEESTIGSSRSETVRQISVTPVSCNKNEDVVRSSTTENKRENTSGNKRKQYERDLTSVITETDTKSSTLTYKKPKRKKKIYFTDSESEEDLINNKSTKNYESMEGFVGFKSIDEEFINNRDNEKNKKIELSDTKNCKEIATENCLYINQIIDSNVEDEVKIKLLKSDINCEIENNMLDNITNHCLDSISSKIKFDCNALDNYKDKTGPCTNIQLHGDIIIDVNKTKPKSQKKSNRPIRKTLSLKKSLSNSNLIEQDEVSLEVSQKPSDIDIIDKVLKLEKTLQDKETELQKLQQVKIYRNLHKLEDLNREIDIWKVGCQDALRDLLLKLREHTSIDMTVLLQNLKVPSYMFQYDADNDCFL